MNITIIIVIHEHELQEIRVLTISFLSYLLITFLEASRYGGGGELESSVLPNSC